MLKHRRTNFNPSQDYFQLRNFWVLLPRLPLHLWNPKALDSIGNTLGHYICMDSLSLTGSKKKMEKFMVEIDIHDRLLETIDIEWRGKLI